MMRHRNVGDQGKFNKPELQGATVTFTAESEVKEPTGKRQGSESQLPLAGLVGLSGYQRLHGIGHGFGAEFKFVTYGPKKVNLQLQNEAIESAIRFTKYGPKGLAPKLNSLQSKLGKPYEKYKDVKLIVVVEVVTQPGSMRTESVTYVIKTQQAGQKKPTKQGEISINITGDLRNPDYSFEFNADNAESNVGKEIMNSLRSAMALMLNEVMDIEERR